MIARAFGLSLLGLVLTTSGFAQDETKKPAAKPEPAAEKKATSKRVVFETSMGKFILEVDEKNAPITAKNFLSYVEAKFFDNTIFHRVIGNFVIQGGGFSSKNEQKKTKAPITNEAKNGLKNLRGAISMARTRDPNSATTQFFINVKDNANLDPNEFSAGYAVFGKVVEGMEIIDKIRAVETGNKVLKARHPVSGDLVPQNMSDVPLKQVVVKTARLQK